MKFYYAPLEGITLHWQRCICNRHFDGIDKYFSPFIAPYQNGRLSNKERNDILPENNEGLYLVPQVLTNNAKDYLDCEKTLLCYGYNEININLGCPSKTVVSKGRGSGFLAKPEELDHFLEEIFSKTEAKVSIKTRIGKDDPEEFERLLEIYNKYQMEELIIHARTQKDLYGNVPNLDVYEYAIKNSKNVLCFNGDIFGPTNYQKHLERFPETDAIMIGRGLLINPGLIGLLKDGTMPTKEAIQAFHDDFYETYRRVMPGDKVVLFKMKELWIYLSKLFTDNKKYAKRIRKAEKLYAYEDAVKDLFAEQDVVPYDERIFRIK